jgi:hypothetical protein
MRRACVVVAGLVVLAATGLALTAAAAAPKADIAISIQGAQRFRFVYTPQFATKAGAPGSCGFRAHGEQMIIFETPNGLHGLFERVARPGALAELHPMIGGVLKRVVRLVGIERRTWSVDQLSLDDCANPAAVRAQAARSCAGSQSLPSTASVVLAVPDAFASLKMYNPAQTRFLPPAFPTCEVPHLFSLHDTFASPLISVCCARPLRPGPLVQEAPDMLSTRAHTTTVAGNVRSCLDPRYSDASSFRLDACTRVAARTSRSVLSGDIQIKWHIVLTRRKS